MEVGLSWYQRTDIILYLKKLHAIVCCWNVCLFDSMSEKSNNTCTSGNRFLHYNKTAFLKPLLNSESLKYKAWESKESLKPNVSTF